ncbi:MAG: TetR/AcrR family transcriptional regulator C-terminal domain-containing protein [Turicibacter sp.]
MSDSLITKKAIASGLKQLMHEKSFNKVSIRDITEQCGLNRQTFYYHFQDKYELINWIYNQEGLIPLMDGITFENWHVKVGELLTLMKNEKDFYMNSISSDESYFKESILKITVNLFHEAIVKLDERHVVNQMDQQFYSEFFAHGVYGTIVSWVNSGMKRDPLAVANNLKDLAVRCGELAYTRHLDEK